MGPSSRIGYILDYIELFGIGYAGFRQVLYLGRAPRIKETLPDFHEKCQVTRHSRVFHGLTGSEQTPRVWGVTRRQGPRRFTGFAFSLGFGKWAFAPIFKLYQLFL